MAEKREEQSKEAQDDAEAKAFLSAKRKQAITLVTVGRDESKLSVGRFPEDTCKEVLKNFYSDFSPNGAKLSQSACLSCL
uniref:Uncharacterized protein n=1 Tax=Ditylenchus dipsaci TaxID=166011 RepID=A0A915E6S9_9BILA